VRYRGYKVLYVDDEPANLTSFKYCFDDRFDVITAGGAEEALALLAAGPVAILLADQRMPGMSGAELCRVAREKHPDEMPHVRYIPRDRRSRICACQRKMVAL